MQGLPRLPATPGGRAPGARADLRRAGLEAVPLGGRGGGYPVSRTGSRASLARPQR